MFQKFYRPKISEVLMILISNDTTKKDIEVIFDVDNTLVPHNAPADERAKKLFKRLDAIGMQYCLQAITKNQE